ncbi:MAG: ADP-ribosylation factor-like protein [Bryobacteraceae bacterium]
MAYLDKENGRIVARIIYDGIPEAGKTTNIRQICRAVAASRRGEMESPGSVGPRTEFFDWLDFQGGYVHGYGLRCQVLGVPGQFSLKSRRRHLLKSADAVVLVADSRVESMDSNRHVLKSLRDILSRADPQVPMIVQANWQDAATALSPADLARELELPADVPVVSAQANVGEGVLHAFLLAIRFASDRIQAFITAGTLQGQKAHAGGPKALHDALLALETLPDATEMSIVATAHAIRTAFKNGAADDEAQAAAEAPPAVAVAEPIGDPGRDDEEPPVVFGLRDSLSLAPFSLEPHDVPDAVDAVADAPALVEDPPADKDSLVEMDPPRAGPAPDPEPEPVVAAAPPPVIVVVEPPPPQPPPPPASPEPEPEPQGAAAPDANSIPAGHLWPTLKARSILASINYSGELRRARRCAHWAPPGSLELHASNGWILHTSDGWVRKDEIKGRQDLLAIVRRCLTIPDWIPDGRAFLLAPDNGSWRLWMVSPDLPSVQEAIERALRSDHLPVVVDMLHLLRQLHTETVALRAGAVPAAGEIGSLALQQGRPVLLSVPDSDPDSETPPRSRHENFVATLENGLRECLAAACVEPIAARRLDDAARKAGLDGRLADLVAAATVGANR